MLNIGRHEEFEHTTSLVQTAIAPQALICVGAMSLVMATLVVLCHLYRTFAWRDGQAVFEADDKLLLTYFYAVIVVFVAGLVLGW